MRGWGECEEGRKTGQPYQKAIKLQLERGYERRKRESSVLTENRPLSPCPMTLTGKYVIIERN